MTQDSKTKTACILFDEYSVPILEVWESFSGWYWFITARYKDDPEVVFGYVVGQEKEWGDIWLPELEEQQKKYKCWKVPQKNWFSISHVTMVDTDKVTGSPDDE